MRSLSIICIFWSCQIKSAAGVFSCFCMQGQTLYSHLANNRTVISPLFLCLNWWRAEDEGWHWQCPFNILIGRSLPPVTHNTQRESYLINNKEKKMKATALCCLSGSCKTLLTPATWNKYLHFNHWEEKSCMQNSNSLCRWFLFKR